MIVQRRLFQVFYILFLLFFIDSRFSHPIFNLYQYFSYVYIALLGSGILFTSLIKKKRLVINLKNETIKIILLLVIYIFLFSLLSQFSSMQSKTTSEIIKWIMFISSLLITYWWIIKLKCENSFIIITYFVFSIIIMIAFISNGSPMDVLLRINRVFANEDRYRLNFGYYHVNGLGNLCTATIIFSILTLYIIHQNVKFKNLIKKTIIFLIIALDFIVLIVLLSTASRNSIMGLGIFAIFIFYFFTINTRHLSKKLKLMLRFFIFVSLVLLLCFGVAQPIIKLFVSSNRYYNFSINLPVLVNNNGLLFGLGLLNPALFGMGETVYGNTYYVDNYYLYVLMETGLVGLCFIAIISSIVFNQLYKKYKNNCNLFNIIVFTCFIVQLINGLGETSLLYPIFPSCFVYWIIYLLSIKGEFKYNLGVRI